jgi:acetyl-CoA carboxylase carboxyltransferase component
LIETATGTEVHFSLAAELGGIKRFLLSGPVQSSMDGEMRALDTAKRLLEAG